MTLGEIKEYAARLCEEYKAPQTGYSAETSGYNFMLDSDYDGKMIGAVNGVLSELATILPIVKVVQAFPIEREVALPSLVRQIKNVSANGKSVPYVVEEDVLKLSRDCETVEIKYEKVPTLYFSTTPNSTVLEFSDEACMAGVYGICSDILRGSGDYEIFESKYQMRLARLSPPAKITFINLHKERKRWCDL